MDLHRPHDCLLCVQTKGTCYQLISIPIVSNYFKMKEKVRDLTQRNRSLKTEVLLDDNYIPVDVSYVLIYFPPNIYLL